MTSNKRCGRMLLAAFVVSLLSAIGLFSLHAAPVAALQSAPTAGHAASSGQRAGTASTHWLKPLFFTERGPAGEPLPAAADFTLDKKVMLTADFQQTQSCAGSADALTVAYGANVTYCYYFSNIGTTTFVTHTLIDDKLGGWGPEVIDVRPGQHFISIGYDPTAFVTSDITNSATWTAVDTAGVSLSRTDSVTVRVLPPRSWLPFVMR